MVKLRAKPLGLGCLGLLLAGGLGLWIVWERLASGQTTIDVPPGRVAAMLSDRLAARVRLDRFEILRQDRFRLTGLVLTDFRDYPYLERLKILELAIEASPRGLLDQRFERVRVRGLQARLAPAPPVEPPDQPLPRIGELVLEPASIRIATNSGDEDLQLCLAAIVRQIGPPDSPLVERASQSLAASGESLVESLLGPQAGGAGWLSSPFLDLQPISELAVMSLPKMKASVRELDLKLAFDVVSSEVTAEATFVQAQADRPGSTSRGARLELSRPVIHWRQTDSVSDLQIEGSEATLELDGRSATVDQPHVDGVLAAADDGSLSVDVSPRWNGLESGRLRAELDLPLQRWSWLDARLHGLEVGRLLPDPGLQATADVELSGTDGRVGYRMKIRPRSWTLADDRWFSNLGGSTIEIIGGLAVSPDVASPQSPNDGIGEPIEVSLRVPSIHGRWETLLVPPEVAPIDANFRGRWQGGATPSLSGRGGLSSAFGRWTADGEIRIDESQLSGLPGPVPQVRADLLWTWVGIDLAQLARQLEPVIASWPVRAFEGQGEAQGRLRGPMTADGLAVDGEAHFRRLQAAGGADRSPWHLRDGESTVRWTWAGGDAPIELRRLEGSAQLETQGLTALALNLEASGRLDPQGSGGQLDARLQIAQDADNSEAPHLGSVHLAGDWHQRSGSSPEVSGNVSLQGFEIGRWQQMLPPSTGEDLLADFQLQGTLSTELEGTLSGSAWTLKGPAQLAAAGFTSTDGSRVSEGLGGRFDLALRGAPSAPLEAEAQGQLGGFLLLWGTFFGDFSTVEASLSARARVEGKAGESPTWHLDLEGSLPEGPITRLTLEGRESAWRYDFTFDDTDLASTYRRYLAPLFEPQLGPIEVSGQLTTRGSGHLQIGDRAIWSLTGDVEVQGLDLASDDRQTAVNGLELDLPLDLRRSGAVGTPGEAGVDPPQDTLGLSGEAAPFELSGPRLAGRLAFDKLTVRDLELPATESRLAVEADSVGLENPVALDVLGGTVALERLTFRHLLRPSRHLESSIELSGIRLERISDELGLFPVEGALSGRLAGVRLSPSLLTVDGGGVIEAFGGTVEIRDISGEEMLSRFPKLRLSADFRDLDLGALTRRIDFGEMTGTLQGNFENLELFRGVPVRFSAQLETVQRPGVPRTVDVKAVNNLTILGTGQRASVLDRGLQKFFDRYTYDRLAIDLQLDQDVLLLRGLEKRGDKELFLRGRMPFRIDVVNAQPGRTVSFQTMVERLKSLDFAGVKTER